MAKKKTKNKPNFNDILRELQSKTSNEDKLETRGERYYFLIVSEGEKTEPNYFKDLARQLPEKLVKVETEGVGMDPQNVVEAAIQFREERKGNKPLPEFDEVWAVFDKDDFPDKNFNAAIEKGQQKNIETAYSNEAFELWYVLHFQYLDTAINRQQYIQILKKQLGTYEKNDPLMYTKLQQNEKSDEALAMKWADDLYDKLDTGNPAKDKPITKVYQLVKRLNEFKK